MEKIKGLAIELDLDHLSVDRGLRGLKDNLRTVNSEMKRNMSAFDRSDRSVQKYETRLMGLNKKLDVQKVAVSEAKKEYEKMVEQHGRGSKEAEKAARDYNNQAAALNNLERYIERTTNELREFEKQQRIASSGWTQLGDKLESYGGKLKGIGDNMNQVGGKMTRGITLPALGAATAVSGVVGAFGWKRLTGLDSAKAQLEGLGYAAKDVERISEQVTRAAEGGMTTMAEGTAVAAGALAAGVEEGKELERYIKLVGDAAVGAKRPVADMAMIFNRVQGSGKLMTMELNSIEQGMPGFSKAMSKHLGVSSEKLRKMVTDGKVTSKDFLDVMDSFAGEMAGSYAKSWDGMVANTKAYIGIIGENFLRGIFEDSKKSLADFIEMLKSPDIQRRAAEMGEKTRVAFGKMKDSIMDVVDWYQNLDDDQKTMIKRLGLMVVAGGPVLQFTGKLTSGLGTVLQATGKVSKAIGVARGAGLVAGLASLGPAGVAGVAVAGLAVVGTGVYALYKESKKAKEVNLEFAQSLADEATELENVSARFDELSEKSSLSNKELAELYDVNEQLKKSINPAEIDELSKKYESLAKGSGLSKEEIAELFEANNHIIEQAPDVQMHISDTGNAFLDTEDKINGASKAVGEYIKSLREYSEIELKAERLKLLEEEREAEEDILEAIKQKEFYERKISILMDSQNLSEDERKEKLEENNQLLKDQTLSEEKRKGITEENTVLRALEEKTVLEILESDREMLDVANKTIKANEDRLAKLTEVEKQIAEIYLQNVGINEEVGKGLKTLDEKIKKNDKELEQLDKVLSSEGKLTEEQQKQYDTLFEQNEELKGQRDLIFDELGLYSDLNNLSEEQRKKLEAQGDAIDNNNKKTDAGIEKERERTKEACRDVDKNVNASDNGTIQKLNERAMETKKKYVDVFGRGIEELNRKASSPISKAINFVGKGLAGIARPYADGTPPAGHPGGLAVVGDGGGSEIVNLPSGRSFLSPSTDTLVDLPRGTHVIPHRETERIMRKAPRYARGTRDWSSALGNSEFARLLVANGRSESSVVVSSESNSDTQFDKLLQATLQQNQLLMQLLAKDSDFHIDGVQLTKLLGPKMSKEINALNKKGARKLGVIT